MSLEEMIVGRDDRESLRRDVVVENHFGGQVFEGFSKQG